MIHVAVKAALEAGEAILEIYAQDFEVEYKADESPLTSADKASHEIIIQALETTPYPVLSEESAEISYAERKGWKTYWLVDPIDGTKEFIKKNGEFTVNIALVENGVPVMGVVYVPVLGALYVGSDAGAWKAVKGEHFQTLEELLGKLPDPGNFQRLEVSGKPVGKLKVVASKSHCNDETREFIADLEKEYGEAELVSRGSSLKLCMVAEGSADIYPRIAPTMEWDTGAAHAVVTAAGGRVFEYQSEFNATDYVTTSKRVDDVPYNKENLLNPYFVVSGLHE
ncbi:3'(2'),5'-bisphosphate nucleotidase CysQ [Pontiellaceae bacterium B12219]|nr:3'(2'),5'-bisphosphate nucleotidase CysQ [Pontiellaceae bacterium B12219]